MIAATLAYPFGALCAKQISAGDMGTKSGVSRRGREMQERDVEDGAIWGSARSRENSPRRMRLISAEERAYLLDGQIRMIHHLQSASSRRGVENYVCLRKSVVPSSTNIVDSLNGGKLVRQIEETGEREESGKSTSFSSSWFSILHSTSYSRWENKYSFFYNVRLSPNFQEGHINMWHDIKLWKYTPTDSSVSMVGQRYRVYRVYHVADKLPRAARYKRYGPLTGNSA